MNKAYSPLIVVPIAKVKAPDTNMPPMNIPAVISQCL